MTDAFDLERTPACARMEDDLAEAVPIVREGGDLAGALPALAAHIEGCSRCTGLLAEMVGEPEEWPDVKVDPVDPDHLFERALLGGLSAPESLVRSRAADRLGGLNRPGPAVLGALAGRARRDPDENVRRAALTALNRLDTEFSIPERLIDTWEVAPSEAPIIAGILERLAESPLP